MADETWLEPRSRIPFAGIVAIVIIVAVVAVFLKIQLSPLFPPSTVDVKSASDSPTGMVTSGSFEGKREIGLHRKEYLQGILNTPSHSYKFTIDVPNQYLTIADGKEEEIQLQQAEKLYALFEYNGVQTRVDIDAPERSMILSTPGKNVPTTIALSDLVTYQGSFTFNGKKYSFQSFGSYAKIDDEQFNLENGAGVWKHNGRAYPVTIIGQLATIEDLY